MGEKQICVMIDAETARRFAIYCAKTGRTRKEVIENLIVSELDYQEKNRKGLDDLSN